MIYRAIHRWRHWVIIRVLAPLALFCLAVFPAQGGSNTIRVGASLSFEGKYAEPSEMMGIGYQMWIDRMNAQGGLLGRPVKLILLDDRSDVAQVQKNYSKLLKKERVDLLLSPYGSPATLVASELSEKAGMVMVAAAAGAEHVFTRGFQYLFGMYAPADRFCIGFLDLLARNGMNRIGIVYEDTVFHQSIYTGVVQWAEMFGVEIVHQDVFSKSDAGFGSLVSNLKSQKTDALIFSSYPTEGYDFIRTAQEQDYKPPVLLMTITSIHPDFSKKAGQFAEGVFGPSQWEPIESIPFPGTKEFVADFRRRTGRLPSYHASAAYTACQILEQAVKGTRSLDHRKLRDYIVRLDKITIIGRFKVDDTGRQIGHNPMVIQWQKGRKEIVYPTKMKTADPVFGK